MAGNSVPHPDLQTKKRKRANRDRDNVPSSKGHKRTKSQVNGLNGISGATDGKASLFSDEQISTQLLTSSTEASSKLEPPTVTAEPNHGSSVLSAWYMSKPLGGRMEDVDPILTIDEKFLIIAYSSSVQVYSTADSLLYRRFTINELLIDDRSTRMVAIRLSPSSPDLIWIACSNGWVAGYNWATGAPTGQRFRSKLPKIADMDIAMIHLHSRPRDILFLASTSNKNLQILRCDPEQQEGLGQKVIFKTESGSNDLRVLRASPDGSVLVCGDGKRIMVLSADKISQGDLSRMRYKTFQFDCNDIICCMDLKISRRPGKSKAKNTPSICSLVVGGARGMIFIYTDIVHSLESLGQQSSTSEQLRPDVRHWHRRAVHALKWSRDGNYIFSGGSEHTLVSWQVDTGKLTFLPHLPGTIENMALSLNGSFISLHLDDNSNIVFSTSEMKPTTYISGIQSATVSLAPPKDSLVSRVWSPISEVKMPIPVAVNPRNPNRWHLCVGNGNQATLSGGELSTPMMQTFDLQSFTSLAKQALTRTRPSDMNITSGGHPISEPNVNKLVFSSDGQWLATVDQWRQPDRDLDLAGLRSDTKAYLRRERFEIHLKFWEVDDDGNVALVSRINAPHATTQAEPVFDLVADHKRRPRFATVGNDGVVRIWRPRVRKQDGVAVRGEGNKLLYQWECAAATELRNTTGSDLSSAVRREGRQSLNGSLAFSEDGSILFAAFGARGDGQIYVINTDSGEVVSVLDDMWRGDVSSLSAISSSIITLSTESLTVYDVVADELRYGLQWDNMVAKHSRFLQLQIDTMSQTFLVAKPKGSGTELLVFSADDSEPIWQESLSRRIVGVTPALSSSGFILLDDTAQLMTVTEAADPTAVAVARPLDEMPPAETLVQVTEPQPIALLADETMLSDDEQAEPDTEDREAGHGDDQGIVAVVNQHKLADIFDVAPAFAALSIQDMFFKVTELIQSEPLAAQ